jgi:hypothetical protein
MRSLSLETILKVSDGGYVLIEKGKKYRFNPPRGTIFLTDKRLIFAHTPGGAAKRILATVTLGAVIGNKIVNKLDKVKTEELNKALEMPESFSVNLTEIHSVEAKFSLGGNQLIVKARGIDGSVIWRTSGYGVPKDWVQEINNAKSIT